jgi:hypothetical protein
MRHRRSRISRLQDPGLPETSIGAAEHCRKFEEVRAYVQQWARFAGITSTDSIKVNIADWFAGLLAACGCDGSSTSFRLGRMASHASRQRSSERGGMKKWESTST